MAIILSNTEAPEDITEVEYDTLRGAIISNVEQGLTDPLMPITDEQEWHLIRLAYNDEFSLDKLQRSIRDAIRLRGDSESTAQRFNLKSYRMKAKQQRTIIADETARRARLFARNEAIGDAAKPDTEVQRIQQETNDTDLQAKLFSNNGFLKALGLLQSRMSGRIWFDDFYNNFMTDWDGSKEARIISPRPVDDAFLLAVYEWLLMSDVKLASQCSLNTVEQAVHKFGYQDIRNEPREWLQNLEWDGTHRLKDWLVEVYGVERDAHGYHEAVGKCWLISMIARIMKRGEKVHTMPVLIGPQGNRKSTSLEILGGKWYATINTSVDKQQDFLMSLNGCLLAEIAELDAISRSADSRVKAILSTSTDKYRAPYGRTVNEYPRTAILVGTTNERGWHKDETGGRRYWPLICDKPINNDWLSKNREQLFAEAKVLYHSGASWWDVPEDEQRRRVMDHYTADLWETRIHAWLERSELWTGHPECNVTKRVGDPRANEAGAHWGTLITTDRICIEALGVGVEHADRRTALRIGKVMEKLGYEQKSVRVGSKFVRVWSVTHPELTSGVQKLLPFKSLEAE
jgi:predicted P-loop ATPase